MIARIFNVWDFYPFAIFSSGHPIYDILRLLDTYAAKSHPSITPLLDHVWSSSRVIEGNVQGGSDFCMILQHKCLVTSIYKYTNPIRGIPDFSKQKFGPSS